MAPNFQFYAQNDKKQVEKLMLSEVFYKKWIIFGVLHV